MAQKDIPLKTSIAPWLTVADGPKAIDFYKMAFDAVETYRLEIPDGGVVVKLSVNGAEFWVSANNSGDESNNQPLVCDNIRMILTVSDPDSFFARALKAGASEVFPVGEEHGWRLGRLVDPFGLHWEIGRPL